MVSGYDFACTIFAKDHRPIGHLIKVVSPELLYFSESLQVWAVLMVLVYRYIDGLMSTSYWLITDLSNSYQWQWAMLCIKSCKTIGAYHQYLNLAIIIEFKRERNERRKESEVTLLLLPILLLPSLFLSCSECSSNERSKFWFQSRRSKSIKWAWPNLSPLRKSFVWYLWVTCY